MVEWQEIKDKYLIEIILWVNVPTKCILRVSTTILCTMLYLVITPDMTPTSFNNGNCKEMKESTIKRQVRAKQESGKTSSKVHRKENLWLLTSDYYLDIVIWWTIYGRTVEMYHHYLPIVITLITSKCKKLTLKENIHRYNTWVYMLHVWWELHFNKVIVNCTSK